MLPVRAVGFPRFKLKNNGTAAPHDKSSRYRDSHQADGSIAVLSNRREGTLEVTVPAPERDAYPEVSPWEGMSGAALWVGDRIVGVIAEHHRRDGLGRLAAARLDRTLEELDPQRCAELRVVLGLPEVVPDVVPPSAGERVTTAYQAQVRDIAPDNLLDRDAELDDLVRFCAADQPYAWWQAGPWAGKSALMSWFVLHPPAKVDVVSFFVTARLDEQSDSDACTSALIEQLAALVGKSSAGLLTAGAQRGILRQLLDDTASRAREVGRRLLLVIDGLDEDRSADRGRSSIAELLPRRPPPEVRILIASRPHPPIPPDVSEDHPLQTIIPRQLDVPEHAREIERRAYLELTQLLNGSQLQRDVLGLITAAGGGLTRRDLEEVTVYCCGPRTAPTALAASYDWEDCVDQLTIWSWDRVAAARLPKLGRVDVFAPEVVAWTYEGSAEHTVRALLNLVHPQHPDAPTDAYPAPSSLHVPRHHRRPMSIKLPSVTRAGARAARLEAPLSQLTP